MPPHDRDDPATAAHMLEGLIARARTQVARGEATPAQAIAALKATLGFLVPQGGAFNAHLNAQITGRVGRHG